MCNNTLIILTKNIYRTYDLTIDTKTMYVLNAVYEEIRQSNNSCLIISYS